MCDFALPCSLHKFGARGGVCLHARTVAELPVALPLCLMLGALQIAKLTEEVAACKEHARKLQEQVRQPPSMLRHTLVLRAP